MASVSTPPPPSSSCQGQTDKASSCGSRRVFDTVTTMLAGRLGSRRRSPVAITHPVAQSGRACCTGENSDARLGFSRFWSAVACSIHCGEAPPRSEATNFSRIERPAPERAGRFTAKRLRSKNSFAVSRGPSFPEARESEPRIESESHVNHPSLSLVFRLK